MTHNWSATYYGRRIKTVTQLVSPWTGKTWTTLLTMLAFRVLWLQRNMNLATHNIMMRLFWSRSICHLVFSSESIQTSWLNLRFPILLWISCLRCSTQWTNLQLTVDSAWARWPGRFIPARQKRERGRRSPSKFDSKPLYQLWTKTMKSSRKLTWDSTLHWFVRRMTVIKKM